MYFNISKIDFKKESDNEFIVLAKINFAGTGEGPTPPPTYKGLYFSPADNIASTTVGYQYNEYYNKHGQYLQTSSDGQNWTDWTEDKTILTGKKMFVRGLDSYVRNASASTGFFTMTDLTEVGGNIMSLIGDAETITTNYCFNSLFRNCTNLTTAPELPATIMKQSCYASMFNGCSSLQTAPTLPATTLNTSCYASMFNGCSSLQTAPTLPATRLANYCYQYMFEGCTNLTKAPELPATTLTGYCYQNMFSGCSSLTQAPELPATTLTSSCYASMFSSCKSLTSAPALPATTLASSCYSSMFWNCSNLNEITVTGTFDSTKATSWVNGVAPTGTFYNYSGTDIPRGTNGIPTGWTEVKPVIPMYFMVENGDSSTIGYKYDEYYNNHGKYLQKSSDGQNWTDWTSDELLMSPAEGSSQLYVKGEDDWVRNTATATGFFTTTDPVNVGGNIMGLIGGAETITAKYCFDALFMYTGIVDAGQLKLPATKLGTSLTGTYCYSRMFSDCTSLQVAPELPATTLTGYCYQYMFRNCTSLTSAPALPATTLELRCYQYMFQGCTELTQAPALPAMTLGTYCYNYMFCDCWNLTQAPALPATTAKQGCYANMFQGCTSLQTAPELPATTLGGRSYNYMFYNCTSLTQAPELPAMTLSAFEYDGMFSGCSSLQVAPELPATTLGNSCYHRMFYECRSLTTAPTILPATTLANNCYEDMFSGCTSLTSAPALPATTLATSCYVGMFSNCSNLNKIKVTGAFDSTKTTNWVYGVAPTGKFYNLTGTTISRGDNGIPTGWTEVTSEVEPLTFTTSAPQSTIGYQYDEYYGNHGKYLKYNIDGGAWQDWTSDVTIYSGDVMNVKGEDNWVRNASIAPGFFSMTGRTGVGGNIMSLIGGAETITTDYCFNSLFRNCTNLTTTPELPSMTLTRYCYQFMFQNCWNLTQAPELPATTLASNCYNNMFNGCHSLQTAPELPATTLTSRCYEGMFSGCTSLTSAPALPATTLTIGSNYQYMFQNCTALQTAPELPATTLTQNCYASMFSGCTSLTSAPELPATRLANYCYQNMFKNCTALTQAPALPAMTLANYCYNSMFYNCINLQTAPELPATTLASNCYEYMFYDCTSLTQAQTILPATTLATRCYQYMFQYCYALQTAPTMPATTLAQSCYQSMFHGCSSLQTAPELPVTTLTIGCYTRMFNGCESLQTAPELPATTLTSTCYYGMFEGCSSLTQAPELPATTLATDCYTTMFNGCRLLNKIKVTGTFDPTKAGNWVQGVAPTGKFYNLTGTTIPVGTNGIPVGWTEVTSEVEPLTFTTSSPQSTIGYQYDEYYGNHGKYLQYNIDGGEWQDWTSDVTIYSGDILNVKGEDNYVRNSSDATGFFSMTGRTAVGGTIAGLVGGAEEITTERCFSNLFRNCSNLTSATLLLSFTTLGDYCYSGMFKDCTALTSVPELPATTLPRFCYASMFSGCTALTQAPELPATELLGGQCYSSMFYGCSSLTTAPDLHATTLSVQCCSMMFQNCTALTQAPELPAMTLATRCYEDMFKGCANLTTAPTLTATTLETRCYEHMFQNCSNLNEITVTGSFNSDYAEDWVSGVSASGTFYNNTGTDIPVGTSGIPVGWTEVRPTPAGEPLWFEAITDNIDFYVDDSMKSGIQYSYDGTNWTDYITNNAMHINQGQKLYLRGQDNFLFNSRQEFSLFYTFGQNDKLNVGGNVMSLINNTTEITTDYCFSNLFNMLPIVDASQLKLPATTLTPYCYDYMFRDCTTLTKAPEITASTLADNCYFGMFNRCSNLNEIKVTGTFDPTNAANWVYGVARTGTFYNLTGTDIPTGYNGIPTGWTVVTE